MDIKDISKQVKENPLNKEECKRQFIKQTNKLGLKHSFDFEEAWEIGLELRRRKEFREGIKVLEKQIKNIPESKFGEEALSTNPVKHTFAGGCYIREVYNPAGELIITKVHRQEHPFFLMEGEMSILTEKGLETIKAPYQGITKVGTKRVIYSHTPCRFITVHATDKTTIEETEKDVVSDDYNGMDINSFNLELINSKK